MDKLTMAHDYAMELVASPDFTDKMSIADFVNHCWKYADLMQAEADKRNHIGEPNEMVKEQQPDINSILHGIDCYFDNSHSSKRDANNLIQSIYEELSGEVKINTITECQPDGFKRGGYVEPVKAELGGIVAHGDNWQPDWSQAPGWANYWARDQNKKCAWFASHPYSQYNQWSVKGNEDNRYCDADDFGYKGRWKSSLRKRPESNIGTMSIDNLNKLSKSVESIQECDHEWGHISAYGGTGDYLVCPCGAEKHSF